MKTETFGTWFTMAILTGIIRACVVQAIPTATSIAVWYGLVAVWFVMVCIWFYGSHSFAEALDRKGKVGGMWVMWVLMFFGALSAFSYFVQIVDAIHTMNQL